MKLDYESAMTLYYKSKREVDLAEGECAAKIAPHKAKMKALVEWIEAKALLDGLKNVPVEGLGTGYWTTHLSAKVANQTEFWEHVKSTGNYSLVETRASSISVKDYINSHNAPVPGVSFSQTQVFKIRAANQKSEGDTQ